MKSCLTFFGHVLIQHPLSYLERVLIISVISGKHNGNKCFFLINCLCY